MAAFGGRHGYNFVGVPAEENDMCWPAKLLHMFLTLCLDRKCISSVSLIKLNNISNISTWIWRCDVTLSGTTQILLSDGPACAEPCSAHLLDVGIAIILDYDLSSYLAASNNNGTHARCIKRGKLIIYNKDVIFCS